MPRWGMVIDLDKCSACGTCAIVCKAENNIPAVGPEETRKGRTLDWLEIISETEGEFPNAHQRFVPRPCMHCDKAPCVKVCPVHATYIDTDGLVAQIFNRCIGCRFCMAACPYTVKKFNWFNYAAAAPSSLNNPDVSVRPVGVVEKCTFCVHRLQKARELARLEGRELAKGEYTPACVAGCPSQAMVFGDMADPQSEVSQLAHNPRAHALLEELGTHPKVIYLKEEK